MNERIVFTRPDGGVSVIIPTGAISLAEVMAKDVPAGSTNARQITTAELPQDNRLYRNAWDDSNPEQFVGVDTFKAQAIAHERRRAKRDELFKPHLAVTAKAAQGIPLAPGENATDAADKMTAFKLAHDDAAQTAIDAATDWQGVKAAEDALNAGIAAAVAAGDI